MCHDFQFNNKKICYHSHIRGKHIQREKQCARIHKSLPLYTYTNTDVFFRFWIHRDKDIYEVGLVLGQYHIFYHAFNVVNWKLIRNFKKQTVNFECVCEFRIKFLLTEWDFYTYRKTIMMRRIEYNEWKLFLFFLSQLSNQCCNVT